MRRQRCATETLKNDLERARRDFEDEKNAFVQTSAARNESDRACYEQRVISLERDIKEERERVTELEEALMESKTSHGVLQRSLDDLMHREVSDPEPVHIEEDTGIIREQAERIAALEFDYRESRNEVTELSAVKSTLSTRIEQLKTRLSTHEAETADKIEAIRAEHAKQAIERAAAHDDAVRSLKMAREEMQRGEADRHELAREMERRGAIYDQENECRRRELKSTREEAIVARAMLEDSQRRMMEMSESHIVDARAREKASRETVMELQNRIMETEISRCDSTRRLEVMEHEKNSLKRRFEDRGERPGNQAAPVEPDGSRRRRAAWSSRSKRCAPSASTSSKSANARNARRCAETCHYLTGGAGRDPYQSEAIRRPVRSRRSAPRRGRMRRASSTPCKALRPTRRAPEWRATASRASQLRRGTSLGRLRCDR